MPQGRLPPEVNRILYVRNLPFNITGAELYDVFGKYGAIRQIRMYVTQAAFAALKRVLELSIIICVRGGSESERGGEFIARVCLCLSERGALIYNGSSCNACITTILSATFDNCSTQRRQEGHKRHSFRRVRGSVGRKDGRRPPQRVQHPEPVHHRLVPSPGQAHEATGPGTEGGGAERDASETWNR